MPIATPTPMPTSQPADAAARGVQARRGGHRTATCAARRNRVPRMNRARKPARQQEAEDWGQLTRFSASLPDDGDRRNEAAK